MSRQFCLTLLRDAQEGTEECVHTHVDAPDQETAIAMLLKLCVDYGVDITGCYIAAMETVTIPEDVQRFHAEARRLNPVKHQPEEPPPFMAPGSHHIH